MALKVMDITNCGHKTPYLLEKFYSLILLPTTKTNFIKVGNVWMNKTIIKKQ